MGMDYLQVQEYLDTFVDHEKDTTYNYKNIKLDRVEQILAQLGNPQDKFKSIHIAGTKGKGSTCAFIFSMLKESGYKIGLYTSPHLINFRERIKISYHDEMGETRERLISEDEVTKIVEELRPHIDAVSDLTLFEAYTIIAFKFFASYGVDFAILETGLGGRLDATNVVKPIICGITSISYDHTHLLGETLEQIAKEKAGIIKDNSLVVTASQPPDAFRVISSVCKEKNARLYELGKDFICDPIGQDLNGSCFDFRGIFDSYENLHISLVGQYQLLNVTLAIGIIQLLRLYDIVISSIAIKEGLENARWAGRMQFVHKNPHLLLDGAQNAASAQALKAAISMLLTPKKSILILGVSSDKDVEGICQHLCRHQDSIIITQAQTPRAMDVDELEKRMVRFQKIITKTTNVEEALNIAVEKADPEDLIVVAGSLYLIGEVFKLLKTINFSVKKNG